MDKCFGFGVAAAALVACGGPFNTGDNGTGKERIVVKLVDDKGNVLAATQPITVNVKFKGHDDQSAQPAPHPGDDHGNDPPDDDHGGGEGGGDDGPGHG